MVGNKARFPVGATVRMKQDAVQNYKIEFQRKVSGGRLGVVTGHTFPKEQPMVTMTAVGRKKECCIGGIILNDWEVVSLPCAYQEDDQRPLKG